MKIRLNQRPTAFSGVNILIILSLGLCGLVAWQWTRETRLFREKTALGEQIAALAQRTNDLTRTSELLSTEARRVEERRKEDAEAIRTLGAETNRLARELGRLKLEVEKATHQTVAYKEALDSANARIQVQNESVRKQNEQVEEIKKRVHDRNEIAEKYNQMVTKYNELMDERNKVVEELNKIRLSEAKKE